MDLDQSKLIDKYERLFAEEGWKELIEDLKERIENIKDQLLGCVSERDLYKAKGLHQGYSYIINLESVIQYAKEQNKEKALEEQ